MFYDQFLSSFLSLEKQKRSQDGALIPIDLPVQGMNSFYFLYSCYSNSKCTHLETIKVLPLLLADSLRLWRLSSLEMHGGVCGI